MRKILAVFHVRNLEFLRDRASLMWNLAFPLILILGFYFAFSNGTKLVFSVGIINMPDVAAQRPEFLKTQFIEFMQFSDLNKAKQSIRYHQLDLLIDLGAQGRYWVNENSANGYLVEKILAPNLAKNFKKEILDGRVIQYVEWVFPGILSMNLMFSCLFGVGFGIVRYRKNGVLKRLQATPLSAFEFLSAQVLSRLIIVFIVSTILYFGCSFLISFSMQGSHFDLLVMWLLGSICMICLGLLVAARVNSEEFASGLLNFITWPMILMSGMWFSLEGAPVLMQNLAKLLPMTHLIHGAREIMLKGATLSDLYPEMLTLVTMSVVFLLLSSRAFQWND